MHKGDIFLNFVPWWLSGKGILGISNKKNIKSCNRRNNVASKERKQNKKTN